MTKRRAKSDAGLATFHVPARGLVAPSAEGHRFGPSLLAIPTPDRRREAIATLLRQMEGK